MKLYLICAAGSLRPASAEDAKKVASLGDGEVVSCEIRVARNVGLLRKYHKLMRMVFSWWADANPEREVGGHVVAPDYDQFRRDVTIAAGFYTSTFALDGSVRLEAQSIAFDRMDEEDFRRLVSATVDVLIRQVVPSITTVDRVAQGMINEITEFIS